jgi:hypothetical protein
MAGVPVAISGFVEASPFSGVISSVKGLMSITDAKAYFTR